MYPEDNELWGHLNNDCDEYVDSTEFTPLTPLTPYDDEEPVEDPEEPEEPEEPEVPVATDNNTCVSNSNYTDDYGDDCTWYDDGNRDSCGIYDNNSTGLTAIDACCSCEGVVLEEESEATDPEEEP